MKMYNRDIYPVRGLYVMSDQQRNNFFASLLRLLTVSINYNRIPINLLYLLFLHNRL